MIITLDGPAGAGKSTAAKMLAQRLNFEVLDTGAMYRAIGLAALRAGLALDDGEALATLLNQTTLDVLSGGVLLNKQEVAHLIRTAEVSAAASKVAVVPVVRQRLAHWQREASVGRNLVCEGRDQGTVVFPDAACKFFLVANPLERARRRLREMAARGEVGDLESLVRAIEERDQRDAARDLSPMVPAADSIQIDTTSFTLTEVVDQMESIVRRCWK